MQLEIKQLKIMAHSIGINLLHCVLSDLRKNRLFPKKLYRNYFNVSDGSCDHKAILVLVENGLMELIKKDYYQVTEEGISVLKAWFVHNIPFAPADERNAKYLIKQINQYCQFMYYKFGEDNGKEIFDYYKNYTVKKLYTSHTVTDTINRFKAKLRRLYRISPEAF